MAAQAFKVSNGLATDTIKHTNLTTAISIDSSGNVSIPQNLTVSGSTTTVSTTDLIVKDKLITLNDGGSEVGAVEGTGLEIEGSSGTVRGYFKTNSTGQWTMVGTDSANVLTFDINGTSTLALTTNLTVITEPVTLNQSLQTSDSVEFAGLTLKSNLILGDTSTQRKIEIKGASYDTIVSAQTQTQAHNYIQFPDLASLTGVGTPATIITTKNLEDIDTISGLTSMLITASGTFKFEGSTEDDYQTELTVTDPTADRTITLPDASGFVMIAQTTDHEDRVTYESGIMTTSVSAGSQSEIFGIKVDGAGGHHFIDSTISVKRTDGSNAETCVFKVMINYEDTGSNSATDGIDHTVYSVVGDQTLFSNLTITAVRNDSSYVGSPSNYDYAWLRIQSGYSGNEDIKAAYTYEAFKNFS